MGVQGNLTQELHAPLPVAESMRSPGVLRHHGRGCWSGCLVRGAPADSECRVLVFANNLDIAGAERSQYAVAGTPTGTSVSVLNTGASQLTVKV